MNFYIHHMCLWFKGNQSPVTYDFFPNKVNVITGDSSTGKSSLLRIIDYCLLSSRPAIVQEVINENVVWYGLSFHLNGKDYIIARLAPGKDKPVEDIYFSEGKELPEIPRVNADSTKVTRLLNKEFGIDNIVLYQGKDTLRVSFRYFLIFCYLTEDIIATMNLYFDDAFFKDKLYDLFLVQLLKLALGLDEVRESDLRQLLASYEKKLASLNRSYKIQTTKTKNYDKNINSIRNFLLDLGMVDFSEMASISQEEVHRRAYNMILEYESVYKRIKQKSELNELMQQEREIKRQIFIVQKLKREFDDYQKFLAESADSLMPIQYLNEHINEVLLHDETKDLLSVLQQSLLDIKKASSEKDLSVSDLDSREDQLYAQLESIKVKIKEASLVEKNLNDFTWLYNFVELKHLLAKVGNPRDLSRFESDFASMNEKIAGVKDKLHEQKQLNRQRMESLNEFVNIYYSMPHGVSDAYNSCVPLYDEVNRLLTLIRPEDNTQVTNVGSKSNYMYLHLCFFLGLHEAVIANKSNFVPNFLFIDQPSIPYYENQDKGDKSHLDDKSKLKNAFGLINRAMERITKFSQKHPFQIIMVEHADEEYWNKLDYFDTRYVFTKEKDSGLIPKNIYNRV